MKIHCKLTFLMSGLFALVACKPAGQASLKTLDQFAGGSARYSCSGSYKDNEKYLEFFRGVKTDEQKQAIQAALSAIDPEFKDRIFLGPINSYVELTSDVLAKCTGSSISKANSKNTSPVLACPAVQDGAAVVYVDEKPANIRSWLVRGLAYYLVHIDSKIELQLSSPSKMVIGFVDEGDILKSKKHLGALIFLDEIAAGDNSRLNVFSHILPKSVLAAANKAERDAAYFDPRKTNVEDRDAFAAYFSAEMIDSAICSDQSRQVLASSFPKTMAFYSEDVGFGLSGVTAAKKYTSMGAGTGSRSQVVSRVNTSASVPTGLKPSSRIMSIENQDGSTQETKIYEFNGSQYWQGANGQWRQSPRTTTENGEQSVNVYQPGKLPPFIQPPSVSRPSRIDWNKVLPDRTKHSTSSQDNLILPDGTKHITGSQDNLILPDGTKHLNGNGHLDDFLILPDPNRWTSNVPIRKGNQPFRPSNVDQKNIAMKLLASDNPTTTVSGVNPIPPPKVPVQRPSNTVQVNWGETPSQPASPSLPWYCFFRSWCQ